MSLRWMFCSIILKDVFDTKKDSLSLKERTCSLAQILQASVKPEMKKMFTFQHDNDPKHQSMPTKEWLQKKINLWNVPVRAQISSLS